MVKATKKLKCRICDKKLSKPGNLKRHVETVHEGSKEHRCQICDKKFGQLGNLKAHVKQVHEGIKITNAYTVTRNLAD